MKLRAFHLTVVIVTALIGPAVAQSFQSGPMKFRRAFFDTADRGDIEWIVADGQITAETPKEFRRFLSLDDAPGSSLGSRVKHGARLEVYLNSPGGNLVGAIQLGEIIREYGLGTRVARTAVL
jgi:hypothetical protein